MHSGPHIKLSKKSREPLIDLYVQQRRSMAAGVRASAPPGAVAAMTRVQAGGHYVDELVVMRWLFTEALEGMMLERKKMLGREVR